MNFFHLKRTFKLPVTLNWILGGGFVSVLFSILKFSNTEGLEKVSYSELILFLVVNAVTAIPLNYQLANGRWNLQKWMKISFYVWHIPMLLFNAWLMVQVPDFMVVMLTALYASYLAPFGMMERRYFILGALIYSFSLFLFYFTGIAGTSPIRLSDRTLVIFFFIFVLTILLYFYWMSIASGFLKSQSSKVQKLLRSSRKDKRKLSEERKTIEELMAQLNKSFQIIKKDLLTAKRIQKIMLPSGFEHYSDLDIRAEYIPRDEVGGDFYDITRINEGVYRLFLADATGHGVQGALITMAIKVGYEFLKNSGKRPGEILEILNSEFIEKFKSLNLYYTCILVDLDLNKGVLRYSSAGHPEQVLIQNSEFLTLPNTGRMIGLSPASIYKDKILKIHSEDRLLLFSDGLFEEPNLNKEFYGEKRLYNVLNKEKGKSSRELVDSILNDLATFTNGNVYQDDLTVISLRISKVPSAG
ncbi:SpoIIE family protein phosphatase [Leptospira sp. 201903070]|uniref:SpoIIE family protein phosphatase n=1 Tax=Leptospira ainlahdjerensis TaxID=2810033 RepID=A0ABS2UGL4_9LEPT|nr:PP2C family protein-serine/threonine phosphatase [Leptospira ainlahdjerensis]MBM9579088.1 SpoIIE family protein phosphatase [Leptospira ainlahdjerensis]